MLAQNWANNCEYENDEQVHRDIPGRFPVGELLSVTDQWLPLTLIGWFGHS